MPRLQSETTDFAEMVEHLEAIARDETTPASARVRAIEVLVRISKTSSDEDREWEALVAEIGRDAEPSR
jgi:hypothetical protein